MFNAHTFSVLHTFFSIPDFLMCAKTGKTLFQIERVVSLCEMNMHYVYILEYVTVLHTFENLACVLQKTYDKVVSDL